MLGHVIIENALMKMGIQAGIQGFDYIVDILLLLDANPREKWMNLYEKTANKYGTTCIRVERGIRYAFECARKADACKKEVDHYIGFNYSSNSKSLSKMYLMLKREAEDENSKY